MTDEITLDAPETPLERFLAAAADMDGITLDEGDLEWATAGGSGGGVLVVHCDEEGALDKTWNEIDAADVAVIVVIISAGGTTAHLREIVIGTVLSDGYYYVDAKGADSTTYVTDSADGYPVRQQN